MCRVKLKFVPNHDHINSQECICSMARSIVSLFWWQKSLLLGLALPSASRLGLEYNFLTSLLKYRYNSSS